MRIVLLILAFVFLIPSVGMIFFPLGNIGIFPTLISLGLATGAYFMNKEKIKTPKFIFGVGGILIVGFLIKPFLFRPEVVQDADFESRMKDSEQESIQELDTYQEGNEQVVEEEIDKNDTKAVFIHHIQQQDRKEEAEVIEKETEDVRVKNQQKAQESLQEIPELEGIEEL